MGIWRTAVQLNVAFRGSCSTKERGRPFPVMGSLLFLCLKTGLMKHLFFYCPFLNCSAFLQSWVTKTKLCPDVFVWILKWICLGDIPNLSLVPFQEHSGNEIFIGEKKSWKANFKVIFAVIPSTIDTCSAKLSWHGLKTDWRRFWWIMNCDFFLFAFWFWLNS